MSETERKVVIIAGANGVGKITFALQFLQEYNYEFLNADEIAKQLSSEKPNGKKISAGKLFFKKLRETIDQKKSILLESTLSGHYLKDFFEIWKAQNYQVIFIFVDSPEISIARIAERVKKGGHFFPDKDVKRRFVRGQNKFWQIYKDLADEWFLIYNSVGDFEQIAVCHQENLLILDEDLFNQFWGNLP